jgi:hypothetical protein
MAGACKIVGSILSILGVAIAAICVLTILRDDAYRRAELASARNPGNAMYELEFGAARVRRGFEEVGAIAGTLLTINGLTLVGLGVVAGRAGRP